MAEGRFGDEPVDDRSKALTSGTRLETISPYAVGAGEPLRMQYSPCNICGPSLVKPVGVGEDFEYWTSPDSFLGVQCEKCGLVYLDPRPADEEFGRMYPDSYHAFDFSEDRFGLVYKVRQRLEARRLLKWAGSIPADATIVDVGCGDGFHLDVLRTHGSPAWNLVGVEPDERAAAIATAQGLTVHAAMLEDAPIEPGSVDLVYLIQTIEHVPDPVALLTSITAILKPGGRLVVVTDNVGSPDFTLFHSRHWGGWHFPRHLHLYSQSTLAQSAQIAGLDVDDVTTIVSPVNWVYSVRNMLTDLGAPAWMIRPLSLEGSVALGVGTMLDMGFAAIGRGALLRGAFRRSESVVGEPKMLQDVVA